MEKDNRNYSEYPIGFLVGRVARTLAIYINRVLAERGYYYSLEHFILMNYIIFHDCQNQRKLGLVLGRDKTGMARLLNSMEKDGLIYRQMDIHDRRNKLVHITERGKQLELEMKEIIGECNIDIESEINPDQLLICKQVLDQLYEKRREAGDSAKYWSE